MSENLTVTDVAPGLWVHTTWQTLEDGTRFPGNGLLVSSAGELVLIDTAWGAEETEALLRWADAELKRPVTRAIVTHFHADSMGGTPALAARGIPVVGHALTRSLGASEGVPLPESIGDLEVGGTATVAGVEIFYPGPAHTRDNVVVWVPAVRALFGGCAVKGLGFGKGNLADAVPSNWPEAITRVRDRYPEAQVVVPGHGRWGDASLLDYTIDLFRK